MKKLFLAIALLTVSSVAQAQKVAVDAMVSTNADFNKVAVSVVTKPVVTLGLGKFAVEGHVLPSVMYDMDGKTWNTAVGLGASFKVRKFNLGYNVFKEGDNWKAFYGVSVKF